MKEMGLKRLFSVCKDVRVIEIQSLYFLGIVGFLGFCDIVIFPSCSITLILQS